MSGLEQRFRIAIIPGDGIGREVTLAAVRVLEAVGAPFDFVALEAGWETFCRTGAALSENTLSELRDCDGAIFGAVSSPSQRVEGYSSPIIAMRKALDLYANLRPILSDPVPGSRAGIDMLIVRENTECLYVKQEQLSNDGERAVAQRVITRRASERIARVAFERARQRDKTRLVTVVHKANVLNISDGLFRSTVLAVADEYPDVRVEEQLVDSMLYRMIREPQRYDVVVAPNLYGDLLSDAGAALVGGLGLAPSANLGDDFVLVEPVHGSAPDIAGQGIANPLAAIRAMGLLLTSLGLGDAAASIANAVHDVLAGGLRTPDLGGEATTKEMTNAVLQRLERGQHGASK